MDTHLASTTAVTPPGIVRQGPAADQTLTFPLPASTSSQRCTFREGLGEAFPVRVVDRDPATGDCRMARLGWVSLTDPGQPARVVVSLSRQSRQADGSVHTIRFSA